MKTRIISAFPGTGKTTLFNKAKGTGLKILDSDSSKFDKSQFPENYIQHINKNIGKVDIILVSSHKAVRDALIENGLKFVLIYPEWWLKDYYIKRYKERGSNEAFIKLLDDNWDLWTDDCKSQKCDFHVGFINGNQYLSDINIEKELANHGLNG